MEDKIREIIEKALIKYINVYNVEDEQYITDIETRFDIKEGMRINFKVYKSYASRAGYIEYKTIVRKLELNAVNSLEKNDESLDIYVEVLSID